MKRRSGVTSVFVLVDPRLEFRHVRRPERDLRDPVGDALRRIRQAGAEREQVALHLPEEVVDVGIERLGPDRADKRVGLVDLAVGVHARVRLGDASAVEKRRGAAVPGSCVDLHAAWIIRVPNHTLLPWFITSA